jgi:hypothetical protein
MTQVESALHRIPMVEVAKAWKVARGNGDEKDSDRARKVMVERIKGGAWNRLRKDQRKALSPLLAEMLRPKGDHPAASAAGGA